MILSVTSYWFENAERGRVPFGHQVLAQPLRFFPSGLKPLQKLPKKALLFLIADA